MLHCNIEIYFNFNPRGLTMNTLKLASVEELAAPVVALNQIAIGYTEKLVEMNLAVLRKQAEAALDGWRSALAVKDAVAAKDYLAAQSEAARELVEGYVEDAKAVSKLSQDTANDVRKVVTEEMEKAAKQAA